MAGTLYCVEKLNCISWLFQILPHFIKMRFKNKRINDILYYIDATRCGIFAARATLRLATVQLERLNFRLVNVIDEAGNSIENRIVFRDLFEVQKDIIADHKFQKLLRTKSIKHNTPIFLAKRAIANELYEDTIGRALFIIQVLAWKRRVTGNKIVNIVLFIYRRPWMRVICNYAKEYGVEVRAIRRFSINWKEIFRQVLGSRMIWLRNVYYDFFSHGLLGLIKRLKRGIRLYDSSLISNTSSRLALEYNGNLNLRKPELYSDLFFWQQSELSGKDIVVTFAIPQDPLDAKKLRECEQEGITPVALDPRAIALPGFPVFYNRPRALSFSGMSKIFTRNIEERYIQQQLNEYQDSYDYWHDFFKRYNIKIFLSWYKYDAKHIVIADALKNLGGVGIVYQRAFEDLPSPRLAVATDVVFGFSKQSVAIELLSNSAISYHIVTGYIGDHRFNLLREPAREIRNNLIKHGAQHILSFFDENSWHDARWHAGHQFMRENYAFLLEKVLNTPWLGLIFKPKKPSTLRDRLGESLAELLRKAEETKRCIVIGGGALHSSYPPALAALASDVAIHGHLCAATAGFEAALAGVPTVLLDREGWSMSSLYKIGKGRVAFTNWQEIWSSCEQYFNNPSGSPGFGSWEPMINEMDSFRDGRGAERAGMYLNCLLDGFKAGLPRGVVMADAAERYGKMWGADKITEIK